MPGSTWNFSTLLRVLLLPVFCWGIRNPRAGEFDAKIKPLLSEHCYDCHGDGMNKGSVVLDEFKSERDAAAATDLWARVLKNVRAGLMPPEKKARLSADELNTLQAFIKRTVFQIDPARPD